MAVDSAKSYSEYTSEINQEYLQDGWVLDDEAAANLHDSRKRTFAYMIEIVRDNNIPGELALNESAIEKFVNCKNNTNVHQQIQFLESEKSTYKAFGNYWLLLAECYYNNGEYAKCLDCISKYEELDTNIFRKDYYLAKTLPLAIASASEVKKTQYVQIAEKYLKMIIDNTEKDEWALRYYAAEIYVDLYTKTKKESYLKSAYNLVLDNVNELVKKQDELNKTYVNEVKEIPIPKDATNAEKKQIKAYNKSLKDNRKTELPQIYEPLAINCDLLFSLADKLKLSNSDKNRIDGILSDAYITTPVGNLFTFSPKSVTYEAEFDKTKLIVPANSVCEGATIRVTVTTNGSRYVYNDWEIEKVDRKGTVPSAYKVSYTSKEAKKCAWDAGSTIKVEITNSAYSKSEPLVLNFIVTNYKTNGFLPDTFDFKQVK